MRNEALMRNKALAFDVAAPCGNNSETALTTLAPVQTSADCRTALGDLRFRALMPDDQWTALPPAIRRRFSKRLAGGATAVFAGEVLETWMSRSGWCLAQVARIFGGPLPTSRCVHLPSVVTVTEERATCGQIWTRLYARRTGFPQVVHSSKRFAGPTGLEEYVGRGLGMTLTLDAREGVLIFRSKDYFLQLFGHRVFLPRWLSPGALYVTHAELPDGKFSFTLQIIHPRLGLLIRQMAIFQEVEP
jgi:uncharacterized protein DUF4166